jgi:hypothetical protein
VRSYRFCILILFASFAVLVAPVVHPEGSKSPAVSVDVADTRFSTVMTNELPLRASPPAQKWGVFTTQPGEVVGTLNRGDSVFVYPTSPNTLPVAKVNTWFGTQNWLKVTTNDQKNDQKTGWVYVGDTENQFANIQPLKWQVKLIDPNNKKQSDWTLLDSVSPDK